MTLRHRNVQILGVFSEVFQNRFVVGHSTDDQHPASIQHPVQRDRNYHHLREGTGETGGDRGLSCTFVDGVGHVGFGKYGTAARNADGRIGLEGQLRQSLIIVAQSGCLLIPKGSTAGGALPVSIEELDFAVGAQLQIVYVLVTQRYYGISDDSICLDTLGDGLEFQNGFEPQISRQEVRIGSRYPQAYIVILTPTVQQIGQAISGHLHRSAGGGSRYLMDFVSVYQHRFHGEGSHVQPHGRCPGLWSPVILGGHFYHPIVPNSNRKGANRNTPPHIPSYL